MTYTNRQLKRAMISFLYTDDFRRMVESKFTTSLDGGYEAIACFLHNNKWMVTISIKEANIRSRYMDIIFDLDRSVKDEILISPRPYNWPSKYFSTAGSGLKTEVPDRFEDLDSFGRMPSWNQIADNMFSKPKNAVFNMSNINKRWVQQQDLVASLKHMYIVKSRYS